MKKSMIIGTIVIIVILAIVGIVFLVNRSNETNAEEAENQVSDINTTEIGDSGNNLELSNQVIRVTSSNGYEATFRLYDTVAANELYNQLPLELEISNYSDAQWMFYPPEELSVTPNEVYHDGKKGELSYYEPWGDVFMLYEDFVSGDEMHRLGINLTGIDDIENMEGSIRVEQVIETESNNGGSQQSTENARIRLSFNNEEVYVRMEDNQTARDFLSMLPLETEFQEYSGTEKITYLPRELDTSGAPSGINPSVGDFTYYAPWGNIAIFYNDFGYSNSLIKLGTIESGIEKLANINQNFQVRIERVN